MFKGTKRSQAWALPRAQPATAVIIPEQEMTDEVDQIKGVSGSYDTGPVAQVKTEVKLKGKTS